LPDGAGLHIDRAEALLGVGEGHAVPIGGPRQGARLYTVDKHSLVRIVRGLAPVDGRERPDAHDPEGWCRVGLDLQNVGDAGAVRGVGGVPRPPAVGHLLLSGEVLDPDSGGVAVATAEEHLLGG